MTRLAWRLLGAEVRGRRLAALAFVLVVAVATAGIVGGLAQGSGVEQRWDDLFARTNGAHVTLFGDVTAEQVAARSGVAAVAGPLATVEGALLVESGRSAAGGELRTRLPVRAYGAPPPALSTPEVVDGRWLVAGEADGIVVERSWAEASGVTPGATLRLDAPGGSATYTVVGTALDTLDCFYPQCGGQAGWVTDEGLARLAPAGEGRSGVVLVRLDDPNAVGRFVTDLQAELGGDIDYVADWLDTRGDVVATNRFFAVFLGIFGVVLVVAAGLVVAAAVGGRVVARRRELATLKAVGVTPGGLTGLVLVENLVLAAVGVVVGFVAGGLAAPRLQLRFAAVMGSAGAAFPAGALVVAAAAVGVVVLAATLPPAVRAGSVPAARALADGPDLGARRPSRVAAVARWLRAGPAVVVGAKDAFARPLRATMAVATLVVSVVALVIALGFDATVARLGRDPALLGDPYDVVVSAPGTAAATVQAAVAGVPGAASWFASTSRRGSVGEATFQVRALGPSGPTGRLGSDTGFVVREGRMVEGPGEAVVGYGLLSGLGLAVGDTIELRVEGRPLPVRVVGWYAESEDSGRIVQIALDDLRRVDPGATGGATYVTVSPGVAPAEVAAGIERGLGPGAQAQVVREQLDELDAFRAAFGVVSVLVVAVALVNLFAVTSLGVRERLRDLAVLKTIGATPRQVVASVVTGAALLAVVATALGVPVGLVLARVLVDLLGREVGLGPGLAASPSAAAVAAVAAGLVAVAALVGLATSRRAATADVAEVLRAE